MVYQGRYSGAQLQKLRELRTKVQTGFRKQAKRREAAKIRAKEIKKQREGALQKQIEKIAEQREVNEIVQDAGQGKVSPKLQNHLKELLGKERLSDKDIAEVKRLDGILLSAILGSMKGNFDIHAVSQLILIKSAFKDLVKSEKQIRDTGKEAEERVDKRIMDMLDLRSALNQGTNYEIDKFSKYTPKPQISPKLQQEITTAKQDLLMARALRDASKIWVTKFNKEIKERGRASKETIDQMIARLETAQDIETGLKPRYEKILSDDKYNVDANLGLAEIYSNKYDFKKAKIFRDRAFFRARGEKLRQIEDEAQEKFLNTLRIKSKPTPERSVFIQKMGDEFARIYLPDIPKNHELYEPTKTSRAISQAEEWLKKRTEPAKNWWDELQRQIKVMEKLKDPGKRAVDSLDESTK